MWARVGLVPLLARATSSGAGTGRHGGPADPIHAARARTADTRRSIRLEDSLTTPSLSARANVVAMGAGCPVRLRTSTLGSLRNAIRLDSGPSGVETSP